ncbi:3668_t:CDS:1 [Dentiscutata heterogama]|uniref:3668_t:CDS:1 n=1 Tax=Dentiscutata heterogama TaxID=1316150 RepID=A0ACA9K0L7_9GLOM|nr:3668_t:CDS:1 [Dentiscutata heterogama]
MPSLLETIQILCFFNIILSITTIFLVSAFTILTHNSGSTNLPSDLYVTFVSSSLSLLVTIVLSIPSVTRKFGYTFYFLITKLILSILWFIIAILIIVRANNGSILDPNFVVDIGFGCAIGVFIWINFVSWSISTILHIRIRDNRGLRKNIDKRIIIQSTNYSRNSFCYDQDAKVLTTPKIIKEIDDLIKNPETIQNSNRNDQTSISDVDNIEKQPIAELDYSHSNTNTTTYTLVNTSNTERSFVPAPQIAVKNDYFSTPANGSD